ncbi:MULTISPECIES: hypothetical protein [unclassified Micromonospora]|uniref:hypothetical protein n=1 Tax=unclassified Micromonospora TaxID=2617518 RepID=UPI001B39281F|nr:MULTISPECIES: hypothetical protein [unclassified Micromonospora]MBQ1041832.1 hypothetical protein [Micromonospora sp. C72]MBQ1054583.1 hypothetical protein [Micromonospora sp. C32]
MTYRQLFDDLIGEPPVSTVDVDRVISGQRRARRLRIGAGTTAVAAVVAAVLVGTTTLIGKPHAQPAKPAPAVTTVPGSDQDLDRIDAAVIAALTRAVPSLAWAVKDGPVIDAPNWASQAVGQSGSPGYRGDGSFRVDGVDLTADLQITRDGAKSWQAEATRACSKNAIECGEQTGPDGEKIRYQRAVWEEEVPAQFQDRMPSRTETADAAALRRDGTLLRLTVRTVTAEDDLPITVGQLIPVVVDRAVALAPMPSPSPAATSAVTTVAGTAADATRLDAALTSALRRQASDFTWLTKWGGASSPTPVGFEPKGRLSVDAPVLYAATFRVGNRAAQVTLRLVRDGEAAWSLAPPCPTAALAARHCTVTEFPGGERLRARRMLTGFGSRPDSARPAGSNSYLIESLRPDGTLVRLRLTQDKPALSMDQTIEIAREPSLVLAPRPPAGTATAQAYGPPRWDYDGAASAAVTAALDAASPDGMIYLLPFRGGDDGLNGATLLSYNFLVQRGGLAGDGEIIVERRAALVLSCATVGALPPAMHRGHAHDGECTESTRPDGNRVVTIVSRPAGSVIYSVFVQRPDRGTVEVVIDNRPNTGAASDMPTDGDLGSRWPKGIKGGTTPPLTLEQVTALAGHPDLINLLP